MDELEQFYMHDIKSANEMQTDAERTKVRIVAQTKQLVEECDRTFRSVRNSRTFKFLILFLKLSLWWFIVFVIMIKYYSGF